jgi:AcrR family transcriptional regulator
VSRTGLREQKKQATRQALREAALRLAIERGPDHVRVDDIAEAAGVSPRTYNNYFPSREHAIVAAITAEREARVAAAVAGAPSGSLLSDAVIDAIVEQYTGDHDQPAMGLITARPALRQVFVHAAGTMEEPLTDVIADRIGDESTAQILAASVAAAVRVALERWLESVGAGGLVAVTGSLPDLLRAALDPLRPALDAAENKPESVRRR